MYVQLQIFEPYIRIRIYRILPFFRIRSNSIADYYPSTDNNL